MNRAELKRVVARRVNGYMQEHNIAHPNSTRQERREKERQLRKRVLKEAPRSALEAAGDLDRRLLSGSALVAPSVIRPELEMQVPGIDTSKALLIGERKTSESGLILP